MEEKEIVEQTTDTENVETQTTEENVEGIELTDTSTTEEKEPVEEKEEVKTFTQDEVDEIVKRRLARKEREYQRELSKYKDTDNVLRSTLNLKDGDDTNVKLREYYEAEGVDLPEAIHSGYSSRDTEVLAKSDAEEIIKEGFDSMMEEAERLASIGYNNLNERDKIIFATLGDKITEEKDKTELRKLGAKDELLHDEDFNNFRKQFNSNVSIETIYGLYKNTQPKKKVENPGSMKSSTTSSDKDFYTFEEASRLTDDDYKNDPNLYKIVEKSAQKW